MTQFLNDLLLAFIPVFVAVDAIGVLPLFLGLTSKLKEKQKKKIILQSAITAVSVAVVFIFVGKGLFKVLGITVADFMIAGGIILFGIALLDLLVPGKMRRLPENDIGAVPLGMPLIVGPAVLTTSLIILDQYGLIPTLISVVTNVAIAALLFYFSGGVIKVIGKTGAGALSKIMALLLAAIAVMMIRRGLG
jgi:multiple antibiotic resistance protein